MRAWIVTAMLLAVPAMADTAGPPTITTHATARDRLPNTVADVQLAIESHGKTLVQVQTTLGQASPPLIAFLNSVGAQRIRTESVDVRPELDESASSRPPRIIGYSGRLATSLQVEAEALGPLLTGALSHGANAIDASTLHPRQSELDAARDRLAAAATKLALKQAAAVADAAGRKPGPLRSLDVDADSSSDRFPIAPMKASPGATPMATEAGDSEVAVSVTAVITLSDP